MEEWVKGKRLARSRMKVAETTKKGVGAHLLPPLIRKELLGAPDHTNELFLCGY
jgi:hypothetical protein